MSPSIRPFLAAAVLALSLAPTAHAQRAGETGAAVKQQTTSIFTDAAKDGDFDAAAARADELFDHVVADAAGRDSRAFVEAAFARRLLNQLAKADERQRPALLKLLMAQPELARELAFAMDPTDDVRAAYALLAKLHEAHPQAIHEYPQLTAAICVVHDRPLIRYINENTAKAPDPVALFNFYVSNRKKLMFGITDVPTPLLVWVVDSTAQIDEMAWALKKYAGDKQVGKRFFDIAYDHEHLRTGRPKMITKLGFTLPNIQKHGGVCADQAYFAMSVGKAIGVPSAYVVGQSAEVGHAWVGYLEARGNPRRWNFDVGRYDAYQGVRGNVEHPQTRKTVPDSYVSLIAESIGTRPANHYAAVAMTDAALRLATLRAGDEFEPRPFGPTEDEAPAPSPARDASAASQLALLELALRADAGYAPAWFAVRDLAKADKMTLGQIRAWASTVQKLTGRKYPDFTLTMLKPMIQSIDNPREQSRLWDSAFGLMASRSDLAAEVRIAQGQLWETLEEPRKAGKCYEDVLRRFVNDGPFAITALQRTEAMLRATGNADKILALYEQTWRRTRRPQQMAGTFMSQSNWYQIGKLYAAKLTEAGENASAAEVLKQIGG